MENTQEKTMYALVYAGQGHTGKTVKKDRVGTYLEKSQKLQLSTDKNGVESESVCYTNPFGGRGCRPP